MNSDVEKFFNKLGINPDEMISNGIGYIYTDMDINPVVGNEGLFLERRTENVCIANILGYRRNASADNVFASLEKYFDRRSKGYSDRSLSMLHYSSEDIVEGLWRSFGIERIVVEELERDKFIISQNGLHRFSLLKIHYLCELQKIKDDPKKIWELNKKYTIPVDVNELDTIKSYCKYLINKCTYIYKFRQKYVDYKLIGNIEIYNTEDKSKIVLNDDELLDFTRNILLKCYTPNLETLIIKKMQECKSFEVFINENFSELLRGKDVRYEGGLK